MSMLIPNVEELVHAEHRYRMLLALLNWTDLAKPLRKSYSEVGRRGYAVGVFSNRSSRAVIEDG